MALFSKTIESAQNDVEKAQAAVTEWESKAASMRAQADELEARSGALILDDESQADKISIDIQSMGRKARAFDGAAAEARQRLLDKQRRVLEVEADAEEKEAQDAEKRLKTQTGKVRELLDQLKKLDGAEYIPDPRKHPADDGSTWSWVPRTKTMEQEVRKHKIRAASIRHFITTGEIPNDGKMFLTPGIDYEHNEFAPSYFGSEYIPDSLYAARDAGLTFQMVGA